MQRYLSIIVTIVIVFFCTRECAAQLASDLVKTSLVVDTAAIEPGKPFNVGVLLKIAPKWHIYWINGGDAGIPTTVEFHLPPGFVASPLRYPTPHRFELTGGIVLYGYSNEVMLTATITPPQTVEPGDVKIGADVNWLVCDESCIPGSAKLNVTVPAGSAARSKDAPLFDQWMKQVPVPVAQAEEIASHSGSTNLQAGPAQLKGEISFVVNWKNQAPTQIEWFPPSADGIVIRDVRIQTTGLTTTIKAAVEVTPNAAAEPKLLDSVLGYTTPGGRVGAILPLMLSKSP